MPTALSCRVFLSVFIALFFFLTRSVSSLALRVLKLEGGWFVGVCKGCFELLWVFGKAVLNCCGCL